MPRPADLDAPPPTALHIAKQVAGPGVLFVVVGLVLLIVNVPTLVGGVIIAVGVIDLAAAGYFALRDPQPVRRDQL